MKIKYLLISMITVLILFTMTLVSTKLNISVVEAAKGGAKLNMPNLSKQAAPKVNLNKTPNTNKTPAPSANSNLNKNLESKSVSGGGKTYTPSKNAKDLPNNVPAPKANTNAAAKTDTNSGGILKNIGLFTGGMMLGGLLGSLFGGFGGEFLGNVFGLLFNLVIFYAFYCGGRYLWNKYRGNKNEMKFIQNENKQPIDITPPQAMNYPNPSSLGTDYNAKRTADYYRSR